MTLEATDSHTVADLSALQALFGEVGEAAVRKEVVHLHPITSAGSSSLHLPCSPPWALTDWTPRRVEIHQGW